ncbi:MAG: hypothetical protein JSV92_01505 [archaeon]|nr:MAG: hypothetical protein JSV92_01505 [archaeon]
MGLDGCLNERKKSPFGRYVDIGRVVFGFFEKVYDYRSGLTLKDKMKMIFKRDLDESFWMAFLLKFLKKFYSFYEPCHCKSVKDPFFKEYEKVFSLSPPLKDFQGLSHHFMRKLQKEHHPFMTENLIEFFDEKEVRTDCLLFPFLIIESIIHGIDDYVDINKRVSKEYTNDVFNVVIGLFGLILYVLRNMKIEKRGLLRILCGGKSRLEELVDSLLFSLVDLSQVPLIEKETINILEHVKKDELNTAKKNVKWRAAGINVFLTFSSIFLRKRKDADFKLISDLIKDYRILELLEKDFRDISKDLRNKDYTPVSVWWKKYRGGHEFKNFVKLLADIYYIDSEIVSKKMKKYPSTKSVVMGDIEEKYDSILGLLGCEIKS